MKLRTRSVALASAGMAVVAVGLSIWQLAKGPGSMPVAKTNATATLSTPGNTAASGLVTRDLSTTLAPASAQVATPTPAPVVPDLRPATSATSAATAATATTASTAPTAPTAAAPAAAVQPSPPSTATPSAIPTIKHRVAPPQGALPPILPNEVNAVVGKALGQKTLRRHVYLEPLARRFVASVDGLGRKPAPTDLWLFKPAPGALKLVENKKLPDTHLLLKSNSQRYAGLVQWIVRTDTAKLIELYARMYPLLQQTYVDLGHPNGYFNDRVIEVIDLLLATPVAQAPLRLRPAREQRPASTATPPRPRFEFDDPALESLATGQKILLRAGPQNAALLKAKLKILRSGLVKLGRPN